VIGILNLRARFPPKASGQNSVGNRVSLSVRILHCLATYRIYQLAS